MIVTKNAFSLLTAMQILRFDTVFIRSAAVALIFFFLCEAFSFAFCDSIFEDCRLIFVSPRSLSYFYEYFNRLLDIHLYLWYNTYVEYFWSPEAEHRSVQLPD